MVQKPIVLRDTREKKTAGWTFDNMECCALKTGDYSLKGLEDQLCIERKGSTGELANNIVDVRFDRELERMSKYKWAFIILEFDVVDVMFFPENSGIPQRIWPKLRISGNFLLKKISEYQIKYGVKVIFASKFGKEVVSSIFREVLNASK